MSNKTKSAKKGFWGRAKESAGQQQALAKREKAKKQAKVTETSPPVPSVPHLPVEKTQEEKRKLHKEGIIKTVVPALLGTAVGFFCFYSLGDGTDFPWFSIMVFVIIISYYAQRLVYPLIGLDLKEFGKKDWFYVEFMAVIFWLVIWTLLLNPPL
ncbi:MAG: hypothetical protein KAR85_07515 [Methanosarcinales archaeon]|nr:hypothetical protein [Methanosarcinales archaeon]